MTNRRVNISLTFATDADSTQLLARILDSLEPGRGLISTSSNVFDLDDPTDEATIYQAFRFDDGRPVAMTPFTDHDQADALARDTGGVVVELPVIADYRKPDAP